MNTLLPDRILQAGFGFWAARVLLSAIELGVFTELARGPRTRVQLQRNLKLAGDLRVHGVVAQAAHGGHQGGFGHAHQQHLGATGLGFRADLAHIGAGGRGTLAPQEVIATDAHDHQCGLVLLQQA